jgi:hypothetical protein
VLAIALTAVVVYLLTTAMEFYLFGVDANRTRVESAQLARTLLDQIADDLASTRLYAPPSASSPGQFGGAPTNPNAQNAFPSPDRQGAGAPPNNTTGNAGGPGAGPGAMASLLPARVEGLFGTEQVIRLDRPAAPNWERAARLVDPLEATPPASLPTTVRYYFLDARHASTETAAREGVRDDRTAQNISGLYRETLPTAAISPEADPMALNAEPPPGAVVELLAPEVVGFALAYFDGKQFVDEWDSSLAGGVPVGVEIRLTLAEPAFQSTPDPEQERRRAEGRFAAHELVEYRRFVYLPLIEPGRPAQPLLPAPQQGGQPGQGSGQGNGNQNGNNGNDNNNNGGGANNGNNAQFQTTP